MFTNPHDTDNSNIKAKLQEWLRTKFGLEDSVEIVISEYRHCEENNCPDSSTTILMGDKNYVIRKPLTYVRKWDVDLLS